MIDSQKIRQILLDSGFITAGDFDAAYKTSLDLKKPVTDILVFRGIISEDALGKLIAESYHVNYISLKNKIIPLDVLAKVPEQAALSFHVIPFQQDASGIHLAMEDPENIEAIEFVKRQANVNILPYYITSNDFAKTVGQYKRNIKNIFQNIIQENLDKTQASTTADSSTPDLPVIKILDTIMELATAEGASDIHINSLEDDLLIRFRVDGLLRDIVTLPKTIQPAIVARIKILSSLKIDEHRTPQDGRFKFKIHEDFIAIRVSVLPTFFGENVVMRLLPESSRALSLEELGVSGENMPKILNNIKKPHGMILVTGPTGSGKTTTLYSVLNILNNPGVNICTIEDPIEYSVRRVNQTQVNQTAGLTFAAGLRSLLRHDPNIIMIGEIRDNETAEIAIHAALTGHLVISTLHTNSAVGAIPRLMDMKVQSFLLASTLNIVIAQRLVRRICPSCMQKITPTKEMLSFISEYNPTLNITDFFSGTGCPECGNTGYKGRISLFEVLDIDKNIREAINRNKSEQDIYNESIKSNMISLMEDGLNKVSAGLTTLEEVIRVTRE